MDKMVRQQKNGTKQAKSSKKKPVKVVYISNPMKVKTSASQFRALVQQLTGQDADFPDPTKCSDIMGSVGGPMKEEDEKVITRGGATEVLENPRNNSHEMGTTIRSHESDISFETFEDRDDDQMTLENFTSGLISSNYSSWCDSSSAHNIIAHEDDLKSL